MHNHYVVKMGLVTRLVSFEVDLVWGGFSWGRVWLEFVIEIEVGLVRGWFGWRYHMGLTTQYSTRTGNGIVTFERYSEFSDQRRLP